MLILCVAVAGCAPTVAETARQEERVAAQSAKLERALAGLTPGEPTNCLSSIDRRYARTETYGTTVLFRISRGRVFRNDMNGNCTIQTSDPIVVTRTPTESLCRGDIAQLIDRVSRFPVGTCSYGAFVPYTRAK